MIQVSASALLIEEAYTPGLSREYVSQTYGVALDDVAKLGSAENPFGPKVLTMCPVQSVNYVSVRTGEGEKNN